MTWKSELQQKEIFIRKKREKKWLRIKKTLNRSVTAGMEGIKWILVVVRVIIHDGRESERKEEKMKAALRKKEARGVLKEENAILIIFLYSSMRKY